MNIGKALAITAVTGILAGCGASAPQMPDANMPKTPSAGDVTAPAAKDCCKGKNACKGQSGCKTETNATCAGHNDCKGKGTLCPKPST